MKKGLPLPGNCSKKRNKTGLPAITGLWELTNEEGYDEVNAPDGWDAKRSDELFLFGADGTGKYTNENGGYTFRWKLDGDRLTVTPDNECEPAVYTADLAAPGLIRLESKKRADGNPYWDYYNRATYIKK